jgi:hypothetical protein
VKLTRHYTLPERLPFDMKLDFNRREFIRTTTVAAFAAVTVPSVLAKTEAVSTVALVGCAHIHTPNYVELLKGRKDVRVKLVWDYNDGRARENANALSTQVAKDLGEVWNDKEITAVVICSETNRHHDLILAAAQAGKHIFAEKPMGITGRESREMRTFFSPPATSCAPIRRICSSDKKLRKATSAPSPGCAGQTAMPVRSKVISTALTVGWPIPPSPASELTAIWERTSWIF